ncbi:MAG TPA: major facilitator superfamily domain-containing protein 6 [Anaerolineae bacterium]
MVIEPKADHTHVAGDSAAAPVQPPRLWPLKILYFIFYAGQGTYTTFIGVYYASLGLSGTQIGLINTVIPITGMISSPLWGMLSDRSGKTRTLLMLAVTGLIAATLALSAAPSFAVILPIVALFALFNTTIIPLLDSTTLSVLGDQRQRYGAQRLWGSIGFIITSAVIGLLLERTGLHAIFYTYTIANLFFLLALIGLPERKVHLQQSMLAGLRQMVRRPPWLLFAICIVLLGLATSGMYGFLSLTLKKQGGSDSLIGIVWTLSAIAETPFMALGAPLLRRFGSRKLMAVALFAFAMRMLLYGLMPAPEWAAGISVVAGTAFGLYSIAVVNYANELAPANLKATSQGLVVALTSLSGIAGAPFSGWLFDRVGPSNMFLILAGCCFLALLFFGIGRLLMNRQPVAQPENIPA